MREDNFWQNLTRPIIGLSPMDGVTDFAFRQMVARAKLGNGAGQPNAYPNIMLTEFVPVEALAHSAERALQAFLYDNNERPVVAQVYGIDVTAFKTAAQIAGALGFDGLDINMGCPAKKVSRRGAGAALITNHELAEQIITACKEGVAEWAAGLPLARVAVKPKIHRWIIARQQALGLTDQMTRRIIPVSVKTRIGFAELQIEEWATFLATQNLAAVSLHGRTLKQLYTGQADWEAIAQGAAIIHQSSNALVLGNGDVANLAEARAKIERYGVDGVLIGRAAVGNPWVFGDKTATVAERKQAAIVHAELHYELLPPAAFTSFRRHLAAYITGLPNAANLRRQLMGATDPAAVKAILTSQE